MEPDDIGETETVWIPSHPRQIQVPTIHRDFDGVVLFVLLYFYGMLMASQDNNEYEQASSRALGTSSTIRFRAF